MRSNPLLTAVILAKDEAELIATCLDSLDVANHIVVGIDHTSSDATEYIVSARQDKRIKVISVDVQEGFAKAKNTLISQAQTPWCLLIDADETVTPSLDRELAALRDDDVYDAYDIPFDTMLLGRIMHHGGWNESHVRVFRPDRCQYSDKPIHEELLVPGTVGTLRGTVIHNTHRKLEHLLNKINSYSRHEADLIIASTSKRITGPKMAYEATKHFIARYIVRRGFLDGQEGFIEAVSQAYSVFVCWGKAWELQRLAHKDRS